MRSFSHNNNLSRISSHSFSWFNIRNVKVTYQEKRPVEHGNIKCFYKNSIDDEASTSLRSHVTSLTMHFLAAKALILVDDYIMRWTRQEIYLLEKVCLLQSVHPLRKLFSTNLQYVSYMLAFLYLNILQLYRTILMTFFEDDDRAMTQLQ